MATIRTKLLPIGGAAPPLVSVKASLNVATPWAPAPAVQCHSIDWRANTYDACEVSHYFGQSMRQPGDAGPLTPTAPIALEGKFIRVELTTSNLAQLQYWVGYVLQEKRHRVTDESGVKRGISQRFTVVGLAWFLGRRQIDSAVIHDGTRIGRPLDFNGGRFGADQMLQSNMHPADGASTVRCFYDPRDTTAGPQDWNATHVIRHLFKHQGPVDPNGAASPCVFTLDTQAAAFLDSLRPAVQTGGRTPLEILQGVVTPRRGLQWFGRYYDSPSAPNGQFVVSVTSLTKDAVPLSGGGVLPACTQQAALVFDDDPGMSYNDLAEPGPRRYDRIRFRGARQTATFSVDANTNAADIAAGWDEGALEAAYKNAAAGSDGYGALSEDDQKNRNDAVRREERFNGVFREFVVDPDWDGTAYDWSLDDGTFHAAFPVLNEAGDVTGALPFYPPDLRVLPILLVAQGGGAPNPGQDYLRPFVLLKTATSPDKYQFADKLRDANHAWGTLVCDTITTSYRMRVLPNRFGFELQGSGPAHTLAEGDWAGAAVTNTDPELSWETMIVTISVEADAYCEGVWPSALSGDAPVSELVIDVGDEYRLDYLVPGTIIDAFEGDPLPVEIQLEYAGTVDIVNGVVTLAASTWPAWVGPSSVLTVDGNAHKVATRDSDTQITLQDASVTYGAGKAYQLASHAGNTSVGGILRDDRGRLTDLAKFTYQFYSGQRRSLEVEFARLDFQSFTPGLLITELGDVNKQTVGTVIDSVRWQFMDGVTRIQTAAHDVAIPEVIA